MLFRSAAFAAVCCALLAGASPVPVVEDFTGQQLIRCALPAADSTGAADPAAAEAFAELANKLDLDIWSERATGRFVDLRVRTPEESVAVSTIAESCTVLIHDIQDLIDQEQRPSVVEDQHVFRPSGEESFDLTYYQDFKGYSDIVTKLKSLASTYPKLATFVSSIGKSVEGRDIPVIRIKGTGGSSNKYSVWFNGGQHAREWISTPTVLYLTESLLSLYGSDSQITSFLDQVEFVIAPVINPDGLEYSRSTNRLWRKNRATISGKVQGVDLNRNWNDHWGQSGGSSSSPSAEDYRGPSAASEPEVQACQNYILSLNNRLAGIDFHSYGQLLLRNFGWTSKAGADESYLKPLTDGMRDAISSYSGTKYSSERAAELYVTTGSTDDWLTDEAQMFGFTIELRDTGKYGFTLPKEQIVPTGQETLVAIRYWLNYLLASPRKPTV